MLNEMLPRQSRSILVQLLDASYRGDDIDALSTNGNSERLVSVPEVFSFENELYVTVGCTLLVIFYLPFCKTLEEFGKKPIA